MLLTRLMGMLIVLVFLTGCAATQKASPINQLEIKMAQLEKELRDRDTQIEELRYEVQELSRQGEDKDAYSMNEPLEELGPNNPQSPISSDISSDTIRVPVSGRDVQRALQSAGYYDGSIDGKVGKKTKQAIRDFQLANELTSDGVVGRKTWDMLKTYLK